MRRRRLILPLVVLATATAIYLTQDDVPATKQPRPKQPYVDLKAAGMEMRAVPPPPTRPDGPVGPASDLKTPPPSGR